MDNESFHRSLEKLHRELHNTTVLDEPAGTHIRALKQDIQKLLDHPQYAVPAHEHESFLMHLDTSIKYFEVSHPNLTALMNTVVGTLNNIGV
jgi:uridine kinase